jgi:sulfur-oxidizing protein SoxY
MIFRSAQLGAMLATLGFLPGAAQAQAAYNAAAFEAKNMAELMKALGASAPTESKDVTITGPDIAENGAVVPIGASTALPGAKRMRCLWRKILRFCRLFSMSAMRSMPTFLPV